MRQHQSAKRVVRIAVCAVLTAGWAMFAAGPASAVGSVKDAVIDGSSNGFMRTDFLEVGARPNGTFGSSTAAPDGTWHPNESAKPGQVGFRADRERNGWGVGTDDGDFFLPGSPLEEFGLNVDGTGFKNTNLLSGVVGSFSSSSTTGDPTLVWASTADSAGVALEQTYSLPTDGSLYLDISAKVTNNNAVSTEVYYVRLVDPDNCRLRSTAICDYDGNGSADGRGDNTWLGFRTLNKIQSQRLDGDGITMVTASQSDGSSLALATTDAESVGFAGIGDWACNAPPIDTVYQLARTYTPGAAWVGPPGTYNACDWFNKKGETNMSDDAIGVIFHRTLAAGASTTFSVRYLLSAAELLKFGNAPGAATAVTAKSPPAVAAGAELPAIGYTTSPTTVAGDWINEPQCAVFATTDTTFSTPLTGVQPVGTYVTHCSGGDSIGYTVSSYVDGTLVVRLATLPPTGANPVPWTVLGSALLGLGALTLLGRRRTRVAVG